MVQSKGLRIKGLAVCLLAAFSLPVFHAGCSSDTATNAVAFLVSKSQTTSSLGLLGTSLAIAGFSSTFSSELSAASFPTPCLAPPGVTDTGTIDAQRSCTLNDDGTTTCAVTIDPSACAILDGQIVQDPIVFTNGTGAEVTVTLNDFVFGSHDLDFTEITYDGVLTITTTAEGLTVVEKDTISALGVGDSEPTVLEVDAVFNVAVAADKLTVNGGGIYALTIGANDVKITDLAFPLDKSVCAGPTSGLLAASVVLGDTPIEGFEVKYTGCNKVELSRFKSGVQVGVPEEIDPTSTATLFEGTVDAILAMALATQNGLPAASEPFDADASIGAADGQDLWCRFFESDTDVPFISVLAAAPNGTLPVAECLAFSASVTNLTEKTTARSLNAVMIELAGPLTDPASIKVLGARSGTAPVQWDAAAGKLSAFQVFDLAPSITNFKEMEDAGAAFLSGNGFGPFATAAVTVPVAAPWYNCLNDPPATDGAKPAPVPNQCDANGKNVSVDVEFTRLGMWLTNSTGSDGLYIKVIR